MSNSLTENIELSWHEPLPEPHRLKIFSTWAYSEELSNTYVVIASNYGKLLGCPAQGVCLFLQLT